ncbi:MAG: macro domain-containing protein [Planctomycetes bacterium]|jgi:O-acetyl-ADP-ribose deacetylase (regulator of RNase III)|nr:macro domain-containing protein [Planctomycetota bacterium]
MIHELSGDLLLSKAELIAHGVAPNDDWKQGIARALREACPAMYKDFRHYCKQESPKPGTLWLWQGVDANGRHLRFCALFTQEASSHTGGHAGPAHTEYVNHALHELKKLLEREKLQSIALPKIATGVGGLEWQHVLPLIRAQLGELKIPVLVYADYKPGLAAEEPLQGKSARHS